MVSSVKRALKVTVAPALITSWQLDSVLTLIEGVLNNRPLTIPSSNSQDESPLTPSHFMGCSKWVGLHPEDLTSKRYQKGWTQINTVVDHFWRRFMVEYIPELNINKINGKELSWQIGEIVVVLSKRNERGIWPLGKILKVLPHSGDNVHSKTGNLDARLKSRNEVSLPCAEIEYQPIIMTA